MFCNETLEARTEGLVIGSAMMRRGSHAPQVSLLVGHFDKQFDS